MYNKIILVGRFTADPELKKTPSGVSACSFALAVNRAYAPKDGERQADFIDCIAWRGTAEFIANYFAKGKAILVEGSLQTRTYTDKNEQKRKAVEVLIDRVHFVESGKNSAGKAPDAAPALAETDAFAEVLDDADLPF